jgi:dihydroorotate dehydrogenase electron transfer subunit
VVNRYYFEGILKERKAEAKDLFSITLHVKNRKVVRKTIPGRFVMVWLPGIDEFPLSPSGYDYEGSILKLTFKVRGEGTKALASLSPGDRLFVRGPYGKGFAILQVNSMRKREILVVGGGVGAAPLLPLVEALVSSSLRPYVVCGFRSASEALFIDELSELVGDNLVIATDDGSLGLKGTVVDTAGGLLKSKTFSYAFACGPEEMLYILHRVLLSKGVRHQMLLERYVKCAIGVCGSCVIDGLRLCKEGPVFDDVTLSRLKEFGRLRRSPSGERVSRLAPF